MSRYIKENEKETGAEVSINNYEDLFKGLLDEKPTIEEAIDQMLKNANIENYEAKRKKILKQCRELVEKNFEKIISDHPNVTKEEAVVVCTYTYEDSDGEASLYRILNTNLVANNRKNGIEKVSKYFLLLLHALRQLTPFSGLGRILYRVLRTKVATEASRDNPNYIPYKVKNEKTFWAFTSTSLEINESIKEFLGDKKDDSKEGTKLTIHGDITGYDISAFSSFDDEREVLLEPERRFIVESVCEINNVIDITCNMIKTLLVLEKLIKPRNEVKPLDTTTITTTVKTSETLVPVDPNETNEIELKVEINKSDLNKEIYFLDNTDENFNGGKDIQKMVEESFISTTI